MCLCVCLCVCLSARKSPKPHAQSLPIYVHVAFGRGSVLLLRTDFAYIYLFTPKSDRIQFPVTKGYNFDYFEITRKLKQKSNREIGRLMEELPKRTSA